jgi:hypothetical protein
MNSLARFSAQPFDLSNQDPPQSVGARKLDVKRLASASAFSQPVEQSEFSGGLRDFGIHTHSFELV